MERGNCALYVVFLDYKQQKTPLPRLKLKRARENGSGLCIIGYMYNIIHFPFPQFSFPRLRFLSFFFVCIAVSYLPVNMSTYLIIFHLVCFGLFHLPCLAYVTTILVLSLRSPDVTSYQ